MSRPQTFNDLLNLSDYDLARLDIGLMNLLSANGLPGSEDLDIDDCLVKLDHWAEEVREETERNLAQFRPSRPRDTIGYLKCWTLCKLIRHRKGLRHHLEPVGADPKVPYTIRGNNTPGPDSSFRSAEPIFLGGLLGKRGVGSCTSFPALYAALGQRLGYPIRQVLVVAHVIIRWDDPVDRFNMDPGPNYINSHPDDYYIDKPIPWTHEEKTCGNWFRPLTPREVLGHFAGLRGCVLEANFKLSEAFSSFMLACRLLPKCPLNPRLVNRVSQTMHDRGSHPQRLAGAIGDPMRASTPTHKAHNPFNTCTVVQHPES
jgi:hypothetical protein